VVGRLTFREDGDLIDCRRMGVGGKAIPPNIDKVTELRSDALFVLLVEKDAAFMRLAEDRFYNTYPCIIITAKGQPDVATRLFLKKLKHTLRIPVLALVDSDPYGLKILAVYMKGAPRARRCPRPRPRLRLRLRRACSRGMRRRVVGGRCCRVSALERRPPARGPSSRRRRRSPAACTPPRRRRRPTPPPSEDPRSPSPPSPAQAP
jgi:hypothetical protein